MGHKRLFDLEKNADHQLTARLVVAYLEPILAHVAS